MKLLLIAGMALTVAAVLFLIAAVLFMLGYNAAAPGLGLVPLTHSESLGVLLAAATLGWAFKAGAPALRTEVQLPRRESQDA